MSSSKFDQMFKFISQYKYEISKNVPDNLKCGKCKNILINAYCVPCGCPYCCDCITEMLNNCVENCPGKTDNCRDVLISNNHVDFRGNAEISNVVIKCPEEMCLFESAIINMEKHVRVCEKKSVKCPFSNVGCDGKKITEELMNDHCQSANFNHCTILMEIIDNMRNDIDKHQFKIENLEKILKSKDEIIDKINEKIELEKENVKQEFDSFKQNLERKIGIIDDKMTKENERTQIEKDKHKQECDEINENFGRKTEDMFAEMQKENQERIESINNATNSINSITMETNKKSEIMETRINELNKIIDYFGYGMIGWTIDKLDERRKIGGWIWSEYFTGMKKHYKIRLIFYADGSGDIVGQGCSIYLCIDSGANDQFLSWPLTADVTIKMISKSNPNINKSITKYCKIEKPTTNYQCSERFNYLYYDLTKDGEMLGNCFVVECFIDFK